MDIYEGLLGDTPITASVLTIAELPELEALQAQVYAALPDKNTLQPLSTEEFQNILNGNGLMIGIYAEDLLIAFRALLDPKEDPEHLGKDCGLDDAQLSRVMYQEISNVSPDYRGHGLQRLMATIIMDAMDVERFDYVCATVKPYNIPSLKDKFAQQLVVKGLKLKYGGKLRYIFFKDLKNPSPTYTESIWISMGDTSGQQRLLKDGFVGTTLQKKDDDFVVLYEK